MYNIYPKDAVEIYTRVLDDAEKCNFKSPEEVTNWIKQDLNRKLTLLAETPIVTLLLCDVKEFPSLCEGKITYSDEIEEMDTSFTFTSPTQVLPFTTNIHQRQHLADTDYSNSYYNHTMTSPVHNDPNVQNIIPRG